jgi:branched-chain amino acid transport system ATP-binding protein
MLELRGLQVTYGSTVAVNGIDLDVPAGQATALLGANGAGKTSTLRAVSRLIPSSGSIVFAGEDVSRMPPEKLASRGLIHVPEGRHVFSALTVHENLQVGQTARSGRTPVFSIDDIYELFPPLKPLCKRLGWALSGGEQQMVAIGRALMASPRLLMLDEPSLGLAPIMVRAVYGALARVKAEMPILLVEQNAAVALKLCDRGYVLLSGDVALHGSTTELGDRQAMLDSYLGHGVEEEAEEAEAATDTEISHTPA